MRYLFLTLILLYVKVLSHSLKESVSATSKSGDQFAFNGLWTVQSNSHGKDVVAQQWRFSLAIIQNNFSVSSTSGSTKKSIRWGGSYVLHDKNTPREIDFNITWGKFAGLTAYGIYELQDGALPSVNLAYCDPGLPVRPTNFKPNNWTTIITGNQDNSPAQIHLSFGEDPTSGVVIVWMTSLPTESSVVRYGTQQGHYSEVAKGYESEYSYEKYKSGYIHTVNLTDLTPGTKYYYICGDLKSGWSDEWTFTTPKDNNDEITVTIFGDLNMGGAVGDEGDWEVSAKVLDKMNREDTDFIINAGDIAYCNGDQLCWDRFFMMVEPLAARKIWMTCYGNHDVYPEMVGYSERFRMPGNVGNGDYYYSFNVGPVHFISFDTELWFLPMNATTTKDDQIKWLQNDLMLASANRAQQPWIVVYGHRPFYCSHTWVDCSNEVSLFLQRDLEPLFYSYGVDLAFFGHIHSMEMSYPISIDGSVAGTYAKPEGTVHIVNGAAGQGFLGPFEKEQPSWSAWRTNTHGYSKITASTTSMKFDFIAVNGTVVSSFVLGQPFVGTKFQRT